MEHSRYETYKTCGWAGRIIKCLLLSSVQTELLAVRKTEIRQRETVLRFQARVRSSSLPLNFHKASGANPYSWSQLAPHSVAPRAICPGRI